METELHSELAKAEQRQPGSLGFSVFPVWKGRRCARHRPVLLLLLLLLLLLSVFTARPRAEPLLHQAAGVGRCQG